MKYQPGVFATKLESALFICRAGHNHFDVSPDALKGKLPGGRCLIHIGTEGSLTEAIDTNTAHGEFLFNLFGSLAQYERALIKERVTAGLAAARRRGRKGGRPPTLDPERVERIVTALDDGASKASVCVASRCPAPR